MNSWNSDGLFERRLKNYEVLCDIGLPEKFPHGVDLALPHCDPYSLPEYVRSERFLRLCIAKYVQFSETERTAQWTLDSIRHGQIENESFLQLYAKRFAYKFLKEVSLPENEWDDVCGEFQRWICHFIPIYKPGEQNTDGSVRIFSFDGFLYSYAYRQGRKKLLQEWDKRRMLVLMEDVEKETQSERGTDLGKVEKIKPEEADSKEKVLERLKELLTDPVLWHLFHNRIYQNQSLRDCAKNTGRSTTQLSQDCTELLNHLAISLEEFRSLPPRTTRFQQKPFHRFAKAWRDLVVEEEFLRKIPKPNSKNADWDNAMF